MQDKAQELQDTEEHRELAILEEPQDMGQQALKTHKCVDALAMHQEASLELPATVEVALEESDPEALERHIPEQEYTLEAVEEPDILGLAHILGQPGVSREPLRSTLRWSRGPQDGQPRPDEVEYASRQRPQWTRRKDDVSSGPRHKAADERLKNMRRRHVHEVHQRNGDH